MITVRTSPAYVNRVRQDWTANGGVYGDGGVYATVTSNDPFAQLGPTLDLTFADVPTDQFTAATTDGYSINLNLSSQIYQIAAQYAVWGTGGLQAVNFADIVTFTRASTATYFNSAGTLTTAAINEARFDFNPSTLAAQGLLIEEQRTNSIRNNTMQGAVAGTPGTLPTNWPSPVAGGISQEIVGVGTENGINYIDFRFFTATIATGNNFTLSAESALQIAAANGQSWASSWFVKVIAAPLPFTSYTNRIRLNDSGGSGVGQIDTVFTPTSILTRYTSAGTIAVSTTAFVQPQIRFGMTIGQAYDVTVRIGLPQLEQGAFATSVIPTTTTALTRSADVASVNTLSPWYNQSAMTFYAEYAPIYTASASVPSNTPHVLQAYNTANSQNNYGIRGAENTVSQIFVARNPTVGAQFPGVNLGSYGQAGVVRKVAYGINASDLQPAANGTLGGLLTNNAAALMATHDKMDVGSGTGGSPPYQLNGWLRRITYYPRRLANADLQTITT